MRPSARQIKKNKRTCFLCFERSTPFVCLYIFCFVLICSSLNLFTVVIKKKLENNTIYLLVYLIYKFFKNVSGFYIILYIYTFLFITENFNSIQYFCCYLTKIITKKKDYINVSMMMKKMSILFFFFSLSILSNLTYKNRKMLFLLLCFC